MDEVIKPILNLDLLSMFNELEFPVLPNVFENALEYQNTWITLSLYETYN